MWARDSWLYFYVVTLGLTLAFIIISLALMALLDRLV